MQSSWKEYLLGFAFVLSSLFILFSDRTDFIWLIGNYTILFVSYIFLLRSKHNEKRNYLVLGLVVLCSLFALPTLSNDYFRFLWDGELSWLGINPFDFTPNELIHQPFIRTNAYLVELHRGSGELSQDHYSTYQTVNQFYFIIATALTNNIWVNVFIFKILYIITLFFGAFSLKRILLQLGLAQQHFWILVLNPLLLIEVIMNLHFEGVMIAFLFISFDLLLRNKFVLSAIIFGIAIQTKLVPLILLPFLLRYLGWKKSILFYTISIGISALLMLVFIHPSNVDNFIVSMRLYFAIFEFNSYILHWYIEYGKSIHGFNPLTTYGPRLSRFALFLILTLSFWGGKIDAHQLFKRMLFGFFVYLLLSSTLHPWYILPLLALGVLTNYTFPIVWSFLIFFSYQYYGHWSGQDETYRLIVNIEYILLFIYSGIEIFGKKTLLKLT